MQYDNQQFHDNNPKFGIIQMKRIALDSLRGRWGEALLPTIIYAMIMLVPSFINNILQMFQYKKLMDIIGTGSTSSSGQNYLYTLQTMTLSPGAELFSSLSFIINIFLAGSLTIGFSILALKLLRRERISTGTIFDGFKNYGQALSLYILYSLLCIAIAMIIVIPFMILIFGIALFSTSTIIIGLLLSIAATVAIIILILRLAMSFFIAADNRNLSAVDALKRSAQIMAGNKGRFFLLNLSFIGWIILASIPASVGVNLILFSGTSESVSVLGSILTVITIAAFCPLLLYMQATIAVFYSNVSGNFSTASTETVRNGFETTNAADNINNFNDASATDSVINSFEAPNASEKFDSIKTENTLSDSEKDLFADSESTASYTIEMSEDESDDSDKI